METSKHANTESLGPVDLALLEGYIRRGVSAGEEWCPVTATATVIGKKWHPAIVHRLLAAEPLGFNALKDEVDGISDKVLSEALDDLEDKRIVDRQVVEDKPVRVEYSLTDLGRSLEPVVAAMAEWGTHHLEAAEDRGGDSTGPLPVSRRLPIGNPLTS